MIFRKFIATLTVCAAALVGSAQTVDFNFMNVGDIYLVVENMHFFRNNEFDGGHVKGYTLPGFTLTPRLAWQWTENVTVEAGAHWIHYWGSSSYPHGTYWGLADYEADGKAMHVVPWLRASVDFGKGWRMVFGSLGSGIDHNLPLPLWDNELQQIADPEAGLRLTHNSTHIDLDVWCDWRDFIFNNSPTQERFVFGSSVVTKPSNPESWVHISVPLHFIAMHNGGEILAQRIKATNNFNAATGVTAEFDINTMANGSYVQVDLLAAGYHQHGNDSIPFTLGYGLFSAITLGYNDLSLQAAWWRGDRFNSLLGDEFFCNMSAMTPGMVFGRYDMFVTTLMYDTYVARRTRLTLYATLYYNAATRVTYANGTAADIPAATSFAFGAVLHLSPRLKIK